MNRRTILKGGLVLAATSHTAVAVAEANIRAKVSVDDFLAKATTSERLRYHSNAAMEAAAEMRPELQWATFTELDLSRIMIVGRNPAAKVANPADPLLDTIREYKVGLLEFNRLAHAEDDDERWNEFEGMTYGPPLARLTQWTAPANTMAGAVAALMLALDHENGVEGMEAADRMVKAALGYLEGLA